MCGLGLVIIPQIDIPHPLISNAEDSATKILSGKPERRWIVTHSYGGLSAQNADLEEIRERGEALPDGLRYTYYAGAAHRQRFDFDELDSWLADIKRNIPSEHQHLFHEGIVRLYTREHGTDPQRVIDFATEISNKTQTENLSDGIRIGIQEEFGGDIRDAIQIALKYPTDLYYPLFEELGGRIGHDHGIDAKHWREHESMLPENTLCWLAEGMTRGAMLSMLEEDQIWWPSVLEFREAIASDCTPEVTSGIAEGLLIVFGDSQDALKKQLDQVKNPADRIVLEQSLAQKQNVEAMKRPEPLPKSDSDLPPL